jgi:hypothetical protein
MASNRVRLSPPPHYNPDVSSWEWRNWFNEARERVGEGPLKVQGYAVAGLPPAADWGSTASGNNFSSIVFVHDETGGPVLAYSDGTDWLRVTDGAVVS